MDRRRRQLLGLSALCVGLIGSFMFFAIHVGYDPLTRLIIAAILVAMMCVGAWLLGASAMIAGISPERQSLAVVGSLLILPWVLFSFLAGYGRPDQSNASENLWRYIILLVSTMAVGGGLVLLKEALSEAGERLYSALGLAAIVMASPIYLVWATIALEYFSQKIYANNGQAPPAIMSLAIWSEILLFTGGLLTYVATAAFTAALGRIRWLGRNATLALVLINIIAALVLGLRGLSFPNPKAALSHWYTIPGFVVGIPAVPWIIPCIIGVVLLWRAGQLADGRRN